MLLKTLYNTNLIIIDRCVVRFVDVDVLLDARPVVVSGGQWWSVVVSMY